MAEELVTDGSHSRLHIELVAKFLYPFDRQPVSRLFPPCCPPLNEQSVRVLNKLYLCVFIHPSGLRVSMGGAGGNSKIPSYIKDGT